jgi:molybdate transport system ATP-binding protein
VSLLAEVGVKTAEFREWVSIKVDSGEVVAVLGPNGSGKSTLIQVLAGIRRLTSGCIRLDGILLDDPLTRRFVPPERRSCGVVFQDYLLFPHLTAQANVAFGLRSRGASKRDSARQSREWLELLGVSERALAKPAELSGGQAQRVALARALATNPRLLLLDEPTSALDVGQRSSIRHELRKHLLRFEGSCVMVTHDTLDAAAMADRLMILENGRVVQTGTLREITTKPLTSYVAELAGLNLLRGRSHGYDFTLDTGVVLVTAKPSMGDVLAVISPRDVVLFTEPPFGSSRNTWATQIDEVHVLGDRARVVLEAPVRLDAEVTVAALCDLRLTEGDRIWASVKATQIDVYPSRVPRQTSTVHAQESPETSAETPSGFPLPVSPTGSTTTRFASYRGM